MNNDFAILLIGLIAIEVWLIRGNVKELIQVQTKILKILESSQSSLSSIESDAGKIESEVGRNRRIREMDEDPLERMIRAKKHNP